MSVLTPNQEIFSRTLAGKTGLNLNVVRSWVLAEESSSAAHSRDASGNQNWLNLGVGPSGDRFNPGWHDPVVAANNTAAALMGTKYKTGSLYHGILSTVHSHPAEQLQAIADSPWDVGHYAGGHGLMGTYHLVSGLPIPDVTATPVTTPTAPTTTPTPGTPKPMTVPGIPDASVQTPIAPADTSLPLPPLHMIGSTIPLPALPSVEIPKFDTTQAPTPAGLVVKPDKPVDPTKPVDPVTGKPLAPGDRGIYTPNHRGRIDMGIDYTGAGAIPALADAQIVSVRTNGTGWPGAGGKGTGAIITYKVLSGANKGRYVFVAENIVPHVKEGQIVKAGTPIATAAGSSPYTEQGWATATGQALAHTHYTEGQVTAEGTSFAKAWGL